MTAVDGALVPAALVAATDTLYATPLVSMPIVHEVAPAPALQVCGARPESLADAV
jgi:hypothetical protein